MLTASTSLIAMDPSGNTPRDHLRRPRRVKDWGRIAGEFGVPHHHLSVAEVMSRRPLQQTAGMEGQWTETKEMATTGWEGERCPFPSWPDGVPPFPSPPRGSVLDPLAEVNTDPVWIAPAEREATEETTTQWSSSTTTSPSANKKAERRCTHCYAEETPQWRLGPQGPGTLCNACGIRYRSGGLFPEYRPAASPSFDASMHSNRHRVVMKTKGKV